MKFSHFILDFVGKGHHTFWTIYKKNSHSFSQLSAYEIHESLTFDETYTKYELKGKPCHIIHSKRSQWFFKDKKLQFFCSIFALYILLPFIALVELDAGSKLETI